MPPVGRPQLPRGIFSIQDTAIAVPDRVLLDTSFVVEALVVSQPLHSACIDYLVRLAHHGTELVYSRLLELELAETAFQLALKERHPKDWKRFRGDGRARRRATALLRGIDASWRSVLVALPSECVEVETVIPQVHGLMGGCGLASYDAVHVATAIHARTRAVVTLDAGFAAAPASAIDVYIDNSRLASCRGRRR